ncbi:MAG: SPOR domain-containing protein [Proteobacteria bacterium]|nr:SPOR domain-containing protein [Pseudomonadota bacterium]
MDAALKQRLLGAAVLMALAVIFVPMFLSDRARNPENAVQNLNIPPAPERNFETRNLSIDAAKPAVAQPPAPTPAPATNEGGKPATADTTATPRAEAHEAVVTPVPSTKTTSPAAAPATPTPVPPPAPTVQTDGRFLVNLGIYADAGHASALVDKVKKLGYPAFAEATEFEGKSAQRVRVGPYADRAAAEDVRLKIKQVDGKLPSSVVQIAEMEKAAEKPTPSETKTAKSETPSLPANRAGAYVVQAGAFKSEEEANKLRDRLRNGGIAAYVEKPNGGETAFWKVRAGPYADRTGADAAVVALKQKFQVSAIVKTQP